MKKYQVRFLNEYNELKVRTFRLKNMLAKYKKGELDFKPDCSYELLHEQYIYMKQYLDVLKRRARIENIDIADKIIPE